MILCLWNLVENKIIRQLNVLRVVITAFLCKNALI